MICYKTKRNNMLAEQMISLSYSIIDLQSNFSLDY